MAAETIVKSLAMMFTFNAFLGGFIFVGFGFSLWPQPSPRVLTGICVVSTERFTLMLELEWIAAILATTSCMAIKGASIYLLRAFEGEDEQIRANAKTSSVIRTLLFLTASLSAAATAIWGFSLFLLFEAKVTRLACLSPVHVTVVISLCVMFAFTVIGTLVTEMYFMY